MPAIVEPPKISRAAKGDIVKVTREAVWLLRGKWRRSRQKGILLLFALLVVPCFGAQEASATTAPQPGRSFPKEYLEYRKAHPEQFKIRGGLRGKVERARAARQAAQRQRLEEGETLAPKSASKDALVATPQEVVSGTFLIPVILVRYSNVAANPYPVGTLQAVLFDGPNPTGTLTNYYTDVSYGNITATGTVFDWTPLPNNDTFYEGTSNGLAPGNAQTGQLLQAALNTNDPTINFGTSRSLRSVNPVILRTIRFSH